MNRETLIWTLLLIAGAAWLAGRAVVQPGSFGVVPEQPAAAADVDWTRTIGLWVAAILTLFTFSFLYRDNVLYKLAEAIIIGVSAGYWMVLAFWTNLIPKLVGRLFPEFVRTYIMPEYQEDRNWIFLAPLVLGVMLLMRLSPRGSWIARWPVAFIIGFTAGMRLISYLQADLMAQIQATIIPLLVLENGTTHFWLSVRNIAIVLGVLACLTYFFFSVEHKGVAGRISRVGIWILMITFGASFAYTVMGRITLLIQRIEFLAFDWLNLV